MLLRVRPAEPPAPSTVLLLQYEPFQVAIIKSPLAAWVYTMIGFPLNVVVAKSRPSEAKLIGAVFQPACGIIALLIASTEVPKAFWADTANE